jgi:hypothetical protein
MKLTLTENELIAIINEKFNLQLNFTDLVIDRSSAFGAIYEKAIRDTLAIYGSNMVVFQDKKIAAVKHLRDLMSKVDAGRKLPNGGVEFGIGLAQAKLAVEKPFEVIDHAHKFNEPKNYI